MNRHSFSAQRRVLIAGIAALPVLAAWSPVFAADADPAVGRIRTFYDALLASMKSAKTTPVKSRYEKLDPAVRAAFDLPAMTRIAIGPEWSKLSPEDQKTLVDQFSRLTIATYANRFDGYSGEKFEVDDATEARGQNRIVKTRLVKSNGEPVMLNYLMHQAGDGWQIIDVYLSGTISELATRRSEFGSLLRSGGAPALIDSLKQRADKMLA